MTKLEIVKIPERIARRWRTARSNTAVAAVPVLHWRSCDGGFQCATARVPLDYAEPRGATISLIFTTLATLRLRSTAEGPPEIPQPDDLQLHLLDLLKIDPRNPGEPN